MWTLHCLRCKDAYGIPATPPPDSDLNLNSKYFPLVTQEPVRAQEALPHLRACMLCSQLEGRNIQLLILIHSPYGW